MSEVAISYKGSNIATMDASGTKTLLTQGKYCEDDIDVVYTRPATPAPTLQTKTKTYTPTESQQTETVTADSGYDGLDEVDVTVAAVSSTYVGSGITRRSSTDLTASGATVTASAGYYASSASKSVASGTAGTPTATKGTVSNHSVSVTPSVTNTTGYITGSTKTGTAVTVSASELVSGNKAITSNGTNIDVANYSTVSVAVSSLKVDTAKNYGSEGSGATALFLNLEGEPTTFSIYCTQSFTRSTSSSDRYIMCVQYDGTTTRGQYYYRYSGAITSDSSHYSWTYSSNVLRVTSSSTSSYGKWYASNNTYFLVYTYE